MLIIIYSTFNGFDFRLDQISCLVLKIILKNSDSSSAFRKIPLQPFLFAMFLVIGFHLKANFDISHSENGGTFYEINNTKVSTPLVSFQNLHFADLATFEKEEKEEKTESESESQYGLWQ
jgi:hypothetical protein